MLRSQGKKISQNKSVGQISKKKKQNNFAPAAHFLVHFFAVVLHDHNVKLCQKRTRYTFYGGNVVCVPVHFVSLPLISLWWPLAFLIFSPPL